MITQYLRRKLFGSAFKPGIDDPCFLKVSHKNERRIQVVKYLISKLNSIFVPSILTMHACVWLFIGEKVCLFMSLQPLRRSPNLFIETVPTMKIFDIRATRSFPITMKRIAGFRFQISRILGVEIPKKNNCFRNSRNLDYRLTSISYIHADDWLRNR